MGRTREVSLMSINLNPKDDKKRKAFDKIMEEFPEIRRRLMDSK